MEILMEIAGETNGASRSCEQADVQTGGRAVH